MDGDIYPSPNRSRLEAAISDEFIDRLVDQVTTGFKGDVGVVPRQFLREFVTQMDLVDENEDYRPSEHYGFTPRDLSPEEQNALSGVASQPQMLDDELVPMEDAW